MIQSSRQKAGYSLYHYVRDIKLPLHAMLPVTWQFRNAAINSVAFHVFMKQRQGTSDGFDTVRTERPHQVHAKIHQKVVPPTSEIALFLYSSNRTLMACQKKRQNFEDSA